QEAQFYHLGKVSRMPAAYQAFLMEVTRRKNYQSVS
ncbi:unnamed protein product, partial [Choristocarpus tenellus]